MQRSVFLSPLFLVFLAIVPGSLSAQSQSAQDQMDHMNMQRKGCEFSLAGTWQSSTNGKLNANRIRFRSDGQSDSRSQGMMSELARRNSPHGTVWEPIHKSKYKIDDPTMPKTVILTPVDSTGQALLSETLDIKTFDTGLFVTIPDGASDGPATRWTRLDPYRYFVVFASGKGDTGFGAAGFAMLIKTDGVHTETNAFGVYPVVNPLERHPIIGVIPKSIRKQFDREPVGDTGSMLRLQVTAGPYNRALEVMKTWERRADENTLLYTVPYLNNAVYLNQLASSLNQTGVLTWQGGTTCTETIKLQKLTWGLKDPIMTKHNLTQTPYYLFKTLRQMNDSLHLDDARFQKALAGEQSSPVVISSR
jgi:hypothetical protein